MENLNLDLFSPKKAELQELATKYAGLKIEGIDDKKGFEAVHKAEMELVKARTSITKICKEYTDQFERKKKEAWEVRDDLLGIIEPIEKDLKEKKAIIEAEKERIRQEELEKKRLFLQNRVDKLAAFEFIFSDLLALAQMSEEEFDSLLVEAKQSFDDKEAQRICEEEKRKEENLLALKNHARSLILNASTFLELAGVEIGIKKGGILSLQDFYQDIEAKRSFLEQQANILEQQKKLDEENARIQKEKDLEAARKEGEEKAKKEAEQRKKNTDEFIKKFSDCSSIQELKEQRVMMFTSISYEVERACKFLEDRIQTLGEIENQERLEKEKKYQDFLKKNEGNFDKIVKEEGKVVLYKKIDEFIL